MKETKNLLKIIYVQEFDYSIFKDEYNVSVEPEFGLACKVGDSIGIDYRLREWIPNMYGRLGGWIYLDVELQTTAKILAVNWLDNSYTTKCKLTVETLDWAIVVK